MAYSVSLNLLIYKTTNYRKNIIVFSVQLMILLHVLSFCYALRNKANKITL